MRLQHFQQARRGAIVPLVAMCLIGLMGMVALAIDIGMVAVAKTQAQNAADIAAMAGVRTFTGQSGNNLTNVPVNAVTAATLNQILGAPVPGSVGSITSPSADVYTSGAVTVQAGGYYYVYNDSNPSVEGFQIVIPGKSTNEPYTAVRAIIQTTSPVFFGAVFGAAPFNVRATAVAAHRPRDVVIVMDLSGSMRFQSCPGAYSSGSYLYPHFGPRNKSLNPDTLYPQFGHYSDTTAAALLGTSSGTTGIEKVDLANLSVNSSLAGPPCLADFMSSGATPAFTRDSTKDGYATTPGGDNYLKVGSDYIKTVTEFLGTSSPTVAQVLDFERNTTGYAAPSSFNGYTEGPGYWGKTFFIWPPHPGGSDLDANTAANHADNGAKDWRKRFFFKKKTSDNTLYWLDHNNILFEPTGSPTTTDGSGATPILKAPQTSTTVTENGGSVTYRYCINYAAIFQWLRTTPMHFPTSMTTGRINYYSTIPDPTGDNNFNTRFWTQSPMTNLSERFWKDYVDFMLGMVQNGANSYSRSDGSNPWSSYIGNGDFYLWGTRQISQKPDNNYRGYIANSGGYASGGVTIAVNNISGSTTPTAGHYFKIGYGSSTIYKILTATNSSGTYTITLDPTVQGTLAASVGNNTIVQFYTSVPRYMNYADNPHRPRHQFWFGPQSWADWLGNYSVYQYPNNTYTLRWPGNVHEAQAWSCKIGISAAIDDIRNNHPNDFIGLTFFSNPSYSTSGDGQHNMAVIPLGRNYQGMKDSLWFPPSTVSGGATTITPYDSDFNNVPRAKGGTCPGMGLMITYNLLSSSTTNLRSFATPTNTYKGYAGGLGRKGAARLVILETDGAPNTRAYRALSGSGADSYYPIRIKNPTNIADSENEFPSSGTYAESEVYDFVKQIVALDTATPPGYSTNRKPALVYGIAYGSMFDPATTSSAQTTALNFLQSVQYHGNVATNSTGTNFPDWQRIYGDNATRQTRMQDAFTRIMQSGVQVSLIE